MKDANGYSMCRCCKLL